MFSPMTCSTSVGLVLNSPWLDLQGSLLLRTVGTLVLKELGRRRPLQQLDLSGNLADLSDKRSETLSDSLRNWTLRPSGSEGWRTAEVTLGGVDTDGLNSKTMASKTVPGLHFTGEAVDVTGWLGGYNFQWAWASGAAAGRSLAAG